MLFIVSMLHNIQNKPTINYKKFNADYAYRMSTMVENDTFAILDYCAKDFIRASKGLKYLEREQITRDDLYQYVVRDEYKSVCSKSKFNKLTDNFINNIESITEDYTPYDITEYTSNYYLVTYRNEIDGNEVFYYLGIAINPESNIYYIWYIGE